MVISVESDARILTLLRRPFWWVEKLEIVATYLVTADAQTAIAIDNGIRLICSKMGTPVKC